MTALKEYQRLETTGLWKESSDSQRKEVLVLFGENSLVLYDKTDMPLSHWSLAAVKRINPGEIPAIFKPTPTDPESLEIDDKAMIDAIEKVGNIISKRSPRRGRIRTYIFLSIIGALGFLGTFWLPQALINHTLSVVPESKKMAIGLSLFQKVSALTGKACSTKEGDKSLISLQNRVFGNTYHKIFIVPNSPKKILALPGKILLLDRTVIEDFDTPEVAAGYLLMSQELVDKQDPFLSLINSSGLRMLFRLLTKGEITDSFLARHAEKILTNSQRKITYVGLIKRFKNSNIATSPFAYAIDVTGETTLELIEGDSKINSENNHPIITDSAWVSLQAICQSQIES
jgi:hypothetical protein